MADIRCVAKLPPGLQLLLEQLLNSPFSFCENPARPELCASLLACRGLGLARRPLSPQPRVRCGALTECAKDGASLLQSKQTLRLQPPLCYGLLGSGPCEVAEAIRLSAHEMARAIDQLLNW